jgi:hypothetical protein
VRAGVGKSVAGVKAYAALGRIRWREQQWANLLIEIAQSGIVREHRFFDLRQAFGHDLIGGECLAQPDESGDQGDTHLNGLRTVKHIGGHERAVFGESKRQIAAASVQT